MFNADVPEEDIQGAIQRLEEKYQAEEFSFQLFIILNESKGNELQNYSIGIVYGIANQKTNGY